MSEPLWTWSATRIARSVLSGEVSAREVVDAHLARIDEVNTAVNAVTNLLADDARTAAGRIDRARRAGEPLGPLAGVPFTVKENIDIAGHPTTHGIPHFRHLVAARDAPPVGRLRAAGAVVVGHTNMPDLTIGGNNTVSQLFGETRNPWGAIRTPGGSSGGDAAATASGMAAIGLGNDAGGSVRLPAMFCGVAALKPTYGRIPMEHRIGDTDPTLASQLFPTDGPIARTVADLQAAFQVLAGTDPRDPRAVAVPLVGPPCAEPIRVAVSVDPGGLGVHPQIRTEIERAAAALADAGYVVEEAEPPRIDDATQAYSTLITTEFGLSWPRIRPLLTAASAAHMELSMRRRPPADLAAYLQATATRHGVMRDWAGFAQRYPLVLGPVYTERPFDAALDDDEAGESIIAMRLCTATTFLGVPAVAVPTGVVDGQPLGVQVIGPWHREDMCLQAAAVLESRFGSFTPVQPALDAVA
ncbi:amidase [Pseudonocardia xinjiangensis]|uniref:amidase n=1 Tax=Pseudonocardia xinjiangensis TaxID=75289 RepID=UPI003D8FC1EF